MMLAELRNHVYYLYLICGAGKKLGFDAVHILLRFGFDENRKPGSKEIRAILHLGFGAGKRLGSWTIRAVLHPGIAGLAVQLLMR